MAIVHFSLAKRSPRWALDKAFLVLLLMGSLLGLALAGLRLFFYFTVGG